MTVSLLVLVGVCIFFVGCVTGDLMVNKSYALRANQETHGPVRLKDGLFVYLVPATEYIVLNMKARLYQHAEDHPQDIFIAMSNEQRVAALDLIAEAANVRGYDVLRLVQCDSPVNPDGHRSVRHRGRIRVPVPAPIRRIQT